jgi:hypothetical protein
MKKVISFSGGRTSAKLVLMAIEFYGAEDIVVIFMDTGAEHPKTYEFIRKLVDVFNVEIVCLRGDFDQPLGQGVGYTVTPLRECKFDLKPFSKMIAKYGVPYIGGMFCTDRMKLTPFKKYCDDKYGKGNYSTWLGIRADELKRVLGKSIYSDLDKLGIEDERKLSIYRDLGFDDDADNFVIEEESELCVLNSMKERKFKSKISYLAEISDLEKEDILNWWSEQVFDLDIPEWLGNCVFCPKKSNLKLAAAQRDEPVLYMQWLDMLYSDSVRVDNNTGHWSKMYRGKQSLEQLIATFDGSTGKEIKARIRGGKMIDTNSYSESCEVFQ